MRGWVVVSQLLVASSIAAVLPPEQPTSTPDNFHTSPPIRYSRQGRKFGGYRIVPKPCEDSSLENKVVNRVCMLNEECSTHSGTVVGTCLEGFLYGACCQLPKGVSITTLKYWDATRATEQPMTTFEKTTSFLLATKPHSYHSPEETILLYKNGSVVDKIYSPDDFLYLGKPQNFKLGSAAASWPLTNDIDFVEPTQRPSHHTWWDSPPKPSSSGFSTTKRNMGSTNSYSASTDSVQSHGSTANPNRIYSNVKVTHRMKPYTYSYDSVNSFTRKPISVDSGDSHDDNLIRLPTLTADKNSPGDSISHILKILNQTKFGNEPVDRTTPEPAITTTQSLYTWISAQPSWQKTTAATWLTSSTSAEKTPSSWTEHNWHNNNSDDDVTASEPAVTNSIYNAAKPVMKFPTTITAEKTPSTWSQYTDQHWQHNSNDVFENTPAVTNSIYSTAKPITKLPTTTSAEKKPSSWSQNTEQNWHNNNHNVFESEPAVTNSIYSTAKPITKLPATTSAEKTPLSSWSQYTDPHWQHNSNDVFENTPAVTHSIYTAAKPITKLPSTTLHHILGPSFHVTPEVKITPKPQVPISESVPTVVVLTPAQQKYGTTESSKPPSKKPIYNLSSSSEKFPSSYKPTFSYDASGGYNVTLYPSTKPLVKKKPASKPIPSILTAVTKQPTSTATVSIYSNESSSNFGYFPVSKPSSEFTKIKPASSLGIEQDNNFPGFSSAPLKNSLTSTYKPNELTKIKPASSLGIELDNNFAGFSPAPLKNSLTSTYKPNADGTHHLSTVISSSSDATITQTITVSTTKPAMTSQSKPPIYAPSPSVARPITQPIALFSQTDQPNDPMPNYPPYAPDTAGVILNSTDDFVAFPPVRDPNLNLTRIQEKPTFTATTLFGDDEELVPQFVVDKTLDEKVHVFVEKIVHSLQGNFEDLEKVLILGESTNNVTVGTGNVTKKPQNPNKKPTTSSVTRPTKRPSSFGTGTTSLSTVSKIPPSLATPVSLFSPNPSTEPIGESGSSTASQYGQSSVRPELDYSSIESQPNFVSTVKNPSPQSEARRECGIRPLRKSGRIVGGKGSFFGEWPWQVLVREATWLGLFTKNKCGGVLITNKYVITAAHCQPGFLANLVAVFGEFDISGEVETKRSVSKNVRRVIVHRGYDAATFENDIALLELETAVQFDSHIVPICMPDHRDDFTGRMATVTGWGRLKYGGGVPSILQEVQVPVIENKVCQEMFQTAGHSKVILNSFLCAGYVNGQKDSCEGDSGGPLTVEQDGHWTLVATVSHGIKCAAPYLPGVYMRTTYYKPWLQTITGVR